MKNNKLLFIGSFLICTTNSRADELQDAFQILNQSLMALSQHFSETPSVSPIPIAPSLTPASQQSPTAPTQQGIWSSIQAKLATLKKINPKPTDKMAAIENEITQLDEAKKKFLNGFKVIFGTPQEIAKTIKELRGNQPLRNIEFDDTLHREVIRRMSIQSEEPEELIEEKETLTLATENLEQRAHKQKIDEMFKNDLSHIPGKYARENTIQKIEAYLVDHKLDINSQSVQDYIRKNLIEQKKSAVPATQQTPMQTSNQEELLASIRHGSKLKKTITPEEELAKEIENLIPVQQKKLTDLAVKYHAKNATAMAQQLKELAFEMKITKENTAQHIALKEILEPSKLDSILQRIQRQEVIAQKTQKRPMEKGGEEEWET